MTGNGLLGSLSSISSTISIGSEAHQGLQCFHLRDIESPNQAFLLCTFRLALMDPLSSASKCHPG